MRIRKRQVPFTQSSLSPALPLSDPHFSRSPVVQLQLNANPLQILPQQDHTPRFLDLQSFDQPIEGGTNTHVCSDGSEAQEFKKEVKDFPKDERGGGGERSNDSRWGSFLSAETQVMVYQLPNSSHQVVGRWCEGEKAFPLKKRRGNFERSKEETTVAKVKKMKTKMNKKCLQQTGNQEVEEEGKETKEGNADTTPNNIGKKKVRGGALMEGSRCSRVNGRGWRCCQQTLVGYSLCEHHLGKGRLRSMTSVRSRSKKAISLGSSSLSSEDKESKNLFPEGDDDDEKKPPLMVSKKKMKLGIVKARSISSLLGQANNAIAVAENNK